MRDKLLPAIGLFFVVILALVSLEVAKFSFIPYIDYYGNWWFIDGKEAVSASKDTGITPGRVITHAALMNAVEAKEGEIGLAIITMDQYKNKDGGYDLLTAARNNVSRETMELAGFDDPAIKWAVAPPEYLGMRALLAWANAITIGAILTLYGDYVTYKHHPDD
jgi:hypothetical protein|tara:strand:- start:976 stop:1467 length:492 start_codon:yes stop_codon:yes gene_type:complete